MSWAKCRQEAGRITVIGFLLDEQKDLQQTAISMEQNTKENSKKRIWQGVTE